MQIAATMPAGAGAPPSAAPPAARLRSRLEGVADLFAWPLRVSHYLELLNPLWSTHTTWARVVALHDETADARTIVLRPGRGFATYRAGQFVPVTITIDGRRHLRTYSISSAPEAPPRRGCIAITVKHVPGGLVSEHLVRRLRLGDYVALGEPQGEFVLPDAAANARDADASATRPLLLLSAGSGVTPIMSMLRSLAARGGIDDVVHVHWAPSRADAIFARELEALAARHPGYRLTVVTTRDGVRDGSTNGAVAAIARTSARHFDAASLDALCSDWRERDAYACGPRALLDAVSDHWSSNPQLASRLRIERFQPALAPMTGDEAGGRVCFRRSGLTLDVGGAESLLDAAENAGLRPKHGCRMGICHSCTVTLRAGRVRDLRDGRVVDQPGARVQICVSAPAGGCEVEL